MTLSDCPGRASTCRAAVPCVDNVLPSFVLQLTWFLLCSAFKAVLGGTLGDCMTVDVVVDRFDRHIVSPL